MEDAPAYGTTRERRADVSYAQLERAATAMLITGTRPTVAGVRAVIGGSPRKILEGLNRFWKDLGSRLSGNPDTLRRLPAAVADLADQVWQRALALASEAAPGADAARLQVLREETELRAHALSQRELDLDQLLRSRERTLKELEEHLRSVLALVSKRDATIESLTSRLARAVAETDDYRRRLATVIERAVAKRRATAPAWPVKRTRPPVRKEKVMARKAANLKRSQRKRRPGRHTR